MARKKSVWVDKGYVSAERQKELLWCGRSWFVMRKAPSSGILSETDKRGQLFTPIFLLPRNGILNGDRAIEDQNFRKLRV